MAGVSLKVRRLAVGDYEVEREWTMERKTVRDFAVSLADGRLFRQAAHLTRCSAGRVLLLEGPESSVAESGVSREAWQGALLALGLAFHLPVLRSVDAEETVRMLVYAARQVRRQRESVFVPVGRRPRTLERQRLRVLATLPGVGAHRARLLLEHFGSIESVVLATGEELRGVQGIGEQTAQRIRSLVVGQGVGGGQGTR
jgi:ERCC4-type nuclease